MRIISSKDEIATLKNINELHCSFFVSFKDAFLIISRAFNLKILELPESHEKMLGKNTKKFLELQGVKIRYANQQGNRGDLETEEGAKKFSASLTGRKLSEEHKSNMSKAKLIKNKLD